MKLKLKLKTQVQYNDKTYKAGSVVEFDKKDANSLTSRGFAEVVKEKKKPTPANPAAKKAPTKPTTKKPAAKKALAKKVAPAKEK